jgi:hypothetical protein
MSFRQQLRQKYSRILTQARAQRPEAFQPITLPPGEKWPWASLAGLHPEYLWMQAAQELKPTAFIAGKIFESYVARELQAAKVPGLVSLGLFGGEQGVPGSIPDWIQHTESTPILGEFVLHAGPLESMNEGLQRHLRGQLSAYAMFYQMAFGQRPALAYHTLPTQLEGRDVNALIAEATALIEADINSPRAHEILKTLAVRMAADIAAGKYTPLPGNMVVTHEQLAADQRRVWGELKYAGERSRSVVGHLVRQITQGQMFTPGGYQRLQAWLGSKLPEGVGVRSLEGSRILARELFSQAQVGATGFIPLTLNEVAAKVAKDFMLTSEEQEAYLKRFGITEQDPKRRLEQFHARLKAHLAPGYDEALLRMQGTEEDDELLAPLALSIYSRYQRGVQWELSHRVMPETAERWQKLYATDPEGAAQALPGQGYFWTARGNVVPLYDFFTSLAYGKGPGGTIIGELGKSKESKRFKAQYRGLTATVVPGHMVEGRFQPLELIESELRMTPDEFGDVSGYRGRMLLTQEELYGPGSGALNLKWASAFAQRGMEVFEGPAGVSPTYAVGTVIPAGTRFEWTPGGKRGDSGEYDLEILEYIDASEVVEVETQTGVMQEFVPRTAVLYNRVLRMDKGRTSSAMVHFKGTSGKEMANPIKEAFLPTTLGGRPLDFAGTAQMKPTMAALMWGIAAEYDRFKSLYPHLTGKPWNEVVGELFRDETTIKKTFEDFYKPYEVDFIVPRMVHMSVVPFVGEHFNVVRPEGRKWYDRIDPKQLVPQGANWIPMSEDLRARCRAYPHPTLDWRDPAQDRGQLAGLADFLFRHPEAGRDQALMYTRHHGWLMPQVINMGIDFGAEALNQQWINWAEMWHRAPHMVMTAIESSRFSRFQAEQVRQAGMLNAGYALTPERVATLSMGQMRHLYQQAVSNIPAGQESLLNRERELMKLLREQPGLQNRLLRLEIEEGKYLYAPSLQTIEAMAYEAPSGELLSKIAGGLHDVFSQVSNLAYRREGKTGVERLRDLVNELSLSKGIFRKSFSADMPFARGNMAALALGLGPGQIRDPDMPNDMVVMVSRNPGNPLSEDPRFATRNVRDSLLEWTNDVVAINAYNVWIGNGDNDGDTWYLRGNPYAFIVSGNRITKKMPGGWFKWVEKPKDGPLADLGSGIWTPMVDDQGNVIYTQATDADVVKGAEIASRIGGSGSPFEDFIGQARDRDEADRMMLDALGKIRATPIRDAVKEMSARSMHQKQIGIYYNPWFVQLPAAAMALSEAPEIVKALLNPIAKGFYQAYGKAQGPAAVKGPMTDITAMFSWTPVVKEKDPLTGKTGLVAQHLFARPFIGPDEPQREVDFREGKGILHGLVDYIAKFAGAVREFQPDDMLKSVIQRGVLWTAEERARLIAPVGDEERLRLATQAMETGDAAQLRSVYPSLAAFARSPVGLTVLGGAIERGFRYGFGIRDSDLLDEYKARLAHLGDLRAGQLLDFAEQDFAERALRGEPVNWAELYGLREQIVTMLPERPRTASQLVRDIGSFRLSGQWDPKQQAARWMARNVFLDEMTPEEVMTTYNLYNEQVASTFGAAKVRKYGVPSQAEAVRYEQAVKRYMAGVGIPVENLKTPEDALFPGGVAASRGVVVGVGDLWAARTYLEQLREQITGERLRADRYVPYAIPRAYGEVEVPHGVVPTLANLAEQAGLDLYIGEVRYAGGPMTVYGMPRDIPSFTPSSMLEDFIEPDFGPDFYEGD